MSENEFKFKEVNIGTGPETSPKQPEIKPEIKPETGPQFDNQKSKKRGLINLFSKKNLPKTLAVVVLFAAVVVVLSLAIGRSAFNTENVKVIVQVPSSISSGDETTLRVDYSNENRVALKDAYLVIDYPSNTFSSDGKEIFQERKDLGTIAKKSQGSEEFKVRLVGDKGESKNITAKLEYQPQNISSRFENSSSSRLEINSVAVAITVDGSEKAISGQEANYLITFENKTEEDIVGLKLELVYDKDFKFESAEPAPQEETNNVWQIDALKKGEKRSINLVGYLNGNEGESKSLKVIAGRTENDIFIQYSQVEYLTLISPSPLLLSLTLKGAEEDCKVNPGEILKYNLEFKNNADVPLRELILKAYIKNNVFNLRSIQLGDVGFFDSRENTITWSGGDIPELKLLEPNQSGSVTFSITLKKPAPMSSYKDKNLLTLVSAEIGTKTVPAKFAVPELKITKDFSCKINSTADLKTTGYYYEPSAGITNSGPIPPKVDQATTYTLHWQIVNGSNDLENVSIRSVLPQGIDWLNNYKTKVTGSQIFYNERTKELVWQIDKIPAGVGYIFPVYEIVFQVRLTPSVNQIGTVPVLINESFLEAKDSFTGITLSDSAPLVNASVPDDPRNPDGVVRQ